MQKRNHEFVNAFSTTSHAKVFNHKKVVRSALICNIYCPNLFKYTYWRLLITMTVFFLDTIRQGVFLIHSLVAFYYVLFRFSAWWMPVEWKWNSPNHRHLQGSLFAILKTAERGSLAAFHTGLSRREILCYLHTAYRPSRDLNCFSKQPF